MDSSQSANVREQAAQEAFAFVEKFNEVFLNPLIILLTAIALLVFVYGAFEYVFNAENEQARSQGAKHMLFGVIGMFIMLTAFAIMRLFAATFGVEGVLDDPAAGIWD